VPLGLALGVGVSERDEPVDEVCVALEL